MSGIAVAVELSMKFSFFAATLSLYVLLISSSALSYQNLVEKNPALTPTVYFMWGDVKDNTGKDDGFVADELPSVLAVTKELEAHRIKVIVVKEAKGEDLFAAVKSPETVGIFWSSHGSSYTGYFLAADGAIAPGDIADRGGNLFLFVASVCHTEKEAQEYQYVLQPRILKYWINSTDSDEYVSYLHGSEIQGHLKDLYARAANLNSEKAQSFVIASSTNLKGDMVSLDDKGSYFYKWHNGPVEKLFSRKSWDRRTAAIKINEDGFTGIVSGRRFYLGCPYHVVNAFTFETSSITTDLAMNGRRDWIACGANGIIARGDSVQSPQVIVSQYTRDVSQISLRARRHYYAKLFIQCKVEMSENGMWSADAVRTDGSQVHLKGAINHSPQIIDALRCQ